MFEQDAAQQAREEMNLLYVAMTRAQQALVVSGHGRGEEKEQKKKSPSWYDRIAAAMNREVAQAAAAPPRLGGGPGSEEPSGAVEARAVSLPPIVPIGTRAAGNTAVQQRGIWLHALLQHLTASPSQGPSVGAKEALQRRLAIPFGEMDALWQQAHQLLAAPQLARFFDSGQYTSACNEMPYVNARGELKRIDRLVEFSGEVWVLDYKLGDSEDAARYRAQMEEYRAAMGAVYAGRKVRCALVFADGVLREV